MRSIIVKPDTWLVNIKSGAMKQAKDLTDIERGAEEWRVISREERRAKQRRKLKRKLQ